MGRLVLVEMMGSMPVQNTTLAIEFHIAMLETSGIVWYIVWDVPPLSLTTNVLAKSELNW